MKTFLLICLFATPPWADLSTHVFFKHFVGTWKAAGELKGESDKLVTITDGKPNDAELQTARYFDNVNSMSLS